MPRARPDPFHRTRTRSASKKLSGGPVSVDRHFFTELARPLPLDHEIVKLPLFGNITNHRAPRAIGLAMHRTTEPALDTSAAGRSVMTTISPSRLRLHAFRNATQYLGMLCWFFAVTAMPLADLAAPQFSVPLFTMLLAALLLKERIGLHRPPFSIPSP